MNSLAPRCRGLGRAFALAPSPLFVVVALCLSFLGAVSFGACAAGTAGAAGDDGAGSSGVGGDLGLEGVVGGNRGIDKDSACATASSAATFVPVAMYIMFDRSGSMLGSKWADARAALITFFGDPDSAGLKVALKLFPDETEPKSCEASRYSTPSVPAAELTNQPAPTDTHEQELSDWLSDATPGGGTPMYPALAGALSWAGAYAAEHPYEKAAVVLVTDGDPDETCEDDGALIAGLASTAFSSTGVSTFAIGLSGSNEALMNHIAAAGNTTSGHFIGGEEDTQQALLEAFNAIRASAVACEYVVPDGDDVDPNRVNVLYTPGSGGPFATVGQVPSAGYCTPEQGGWYYDDPLNPTKIVLCGATCAAVQADEGAVIEVLLGCVTVVA